MFVPNRIAVEHINWPHFLIQIHISCQGIVCVMSRAEVCNAASGNTKTPENWVGEVYRQTER